MLPFDVGGLVAQKQKEDQDIQLATHVQALDLMGYVAVNVVESDRVALQKLGYAPTSLTFVSANLKQPQDLPVPVQPWIVQEYAGKKIGITGVFIPESEFFTSVDQALGKVLPDLAGKTDFIVVLAYGDQDQAVRLAQKYPAMDMVIGNSLAGAGAEVLVWANKDQAVLTPKAKGVGLVGLSLDPAAVLSATTAAPVNTGLGESVASAPRIEALIADMNKKLVLARTQKKNEQHEELMHNLELSPHEFIEREAGGLR